LIGATTENPSFEIISALLSRCRVYVLEPLTETQIAALLRRALEDRERGLGALELTADDDALELIASYSSGDCRNAYNTLEVAAQLAIEPSRAGTNHIGKALAGMAIQQRVLIYDKSGEEHYNLISALHKSVRNSDPDAALYWLARMFAAGEDPLYLARRVVRMAVEDIGLAAPEALNLCLSAKQAMEFLGSPEGDLALAEAVVYLSLAPKSNSVYTAYSAVQQEIEHTRQEPVPLHLRNAPTRLMKELDYGKGYLYAHDEEGRVADMDCLPDSLRGHSYYQPTQEGREKLLAQRMEEIRRIRSAKRTIDNL
jgi:putative ATPase